MDGNQQSGVKNLAVDHSLVIPSVEIMQQAQSGQQYTALGNQIKWAKAVGKIRILLNAIQLYISQKM